jgi:DNA-binding NarL/FixJ family response regulator
MSMATATALGARPLLRELRALGAKPAAEPSGGPALTARELEVLTLVAQGRSNRDIGLVLFISSKTVSVHVSNLLAKLQASGRMEAVAIARRRGLMQEA